jgi:hypothetical protein
MARTPATPTPAPPTPAPAPEPTQPTPVSDTGFDWSKLDAPVAMENKRTFGGVTANVIETVPEPIRQRAEASLTVNAERVKAKANSSAKRARIDYHWSLQIVPDKATGEQFVKLITKYAKYRPAEVTIPHAGPTSPKGQVTARTGDVNHFRQMPDGEYVVVSATADGAVMGVRYSVRPFEQRGDTSRLPGSA